MWYASRFATDDHVWVQKLSQQDRDQSYGPYRVIFDMITFIAGELRRAYELAKDALEFPFVSLEKHTEE